MTSLFLRVHRFLFVRKRFYKLNRFLYRVSLRGIGVLNYETDAVSGESRFLTSLLQQRPKIVVLDVGANVGAYSNLVASLDENAQIYAFEPHPRSFLQLRAAASNRYCAINAGVGDQPGRLPLFDYASADGSQHASLYRAVIEDIHDSAAAETFVDVLTIDDFIRDQNIDSVGLLKIDTEGHEYNVLKGASDAIRSGTIQVIHFEFNEMNVISRVFMKDFMDLLGNYRLYRMFPDGLAELGRYNAATWEVFAYQNIVAVHFSSNFDASA